MMPDRIQQIVQHPETRRFGKFAIVGVLNTLIDMTVYLLLHSVFGVYYLTANVFAFVTGALNSYFFNRRWTFRSTAADWQREMIQYFLVILTGFFINEGLLFLLVDKAGLGTILAKCIVIGVVLWWNFGVNRLWTFRKSLPQ